MNILTTILLKEDQIEGLLSRNPHINIHTCRSLMDISDEQLQITEVLISYSTGITEDLLRKMPNLKWIQVFSSGVDALPLSSIANRNIRVTNARGAHKVPMAEFAFGLMLQEAKQLLTLYEQQQRNEWNSKIRFEELEGKTVCLLGTGAIGQEIAARCKVFGMRTVGINRSGKQAEHFDCIYQFDAEELPLNEADYLILIAPLTRETENWLGAARLQQLKQEAVLLNLGRGDLVVERDLIHALEEKQFKRAYLDVFQVEPLPQDSPLWKLDNCVITPHVSAISKRYNDRCTAIFIDNVSRYMSRESLINEVNLEAGY
ncbi:D-2-hydroxyacid dehydrogenase [Paenibacillus sp. SC116]|uniref:D-2-hydroxyacid dehydrogenase n=1 Tax=Paenibacillus sp. SC116 TaxID=2968986 RepID=UPI00215B0D01|nr:D-2-hydroxyacid dehydrogenase [Paenibacillus sp. SC116]MCR8842710.1 D-2-hydroxyacid dehydrogenase [Paenibacillus sp. SC116]